MSENSFVKPNVRGFGHIVGTCLERRYQERLKDDGAFTRTGLINELFEGERPSARTVWRLLESEDWPQSDTVRKIGDQLHRLKDIAQVSDTLRGNWDMAAHDQAGLPKRSTITIMSSDEDPKAMDDRRVAVSVAENILCRQCQYVFLFPPYPKKRLDFVQGRLVAAVFAASSEFDNEQIEKADNNAGKKAADWEGYIKDRLYTFSTTNSKASWELWGKTPRYTVLYNLWSRDRDVFPSYGMYFSRGVSILSNPMEESSQISSGWEFLTRDEGKALFNLIQKDPPETYIPPAENDGDWDEDAPVILPRDRTEWPKPGDS